MQAICPDCKILYSNATQDAAKQQSQAEAALTQGIDVMVLDPVDATAAAGIVTKASQQNVPVVSYDRLILDAPVDYYTSFDNKQVGRLQATSLTQKLTQDGQRQGADHHDQRRPRGLERGALQEGRAQRLRQHRDRHREGVRHSRLAGLERPERGAAGDHGAGNNGFKGVYGANDDMAGGAIAAMKSPASTRRPGRARPGRDGRWNPADLGGQQYMTCLQGGQAGGQRAAELAVAWQRQDTGPRPDRQVRGQRGRQNMDNGQGQIPRSSSRRSRSRRTTSSPL